MKRLIITSTNSIGRFFFALAADGVFFKIFYNYLNWLVIWARVMRAQAGGSRTRQLLEDSAQLHIGRAFVELADLGIAVEFFGGKFLDKAVATVNFQCL